MALLSMMKKGIIMKKGDYGYYYDSLYETIINHKPQLVTKEQTLLQMKILEDAIKGLK